MSTSRTLISLLNQTPKIHSIPVCESSEAYEFKITYLHDGLPTEILVSKGKVPSKEQKTEVATHIIEYLQGQDQEDALWEALRSDTQLGKFFHAQRGKTVPSHTKKSSSLGHLWKKLLVVNSGLANWYDRIMRTNSISNSKSLFVDLENLISDLIKPNIDLQNDVGTNQINFLTLRQKIDLLNLQDENGTNLVARWFMDDTVRSDNSVNVTDQMFNFLNDASLKIPGKEIYHLFMGRDEMGCNALIYAASRLTHHERIKLVETRLLEIITLLLKLRDAGIVTTKEIQEDMRRQTNKQCYTLLFGIKFARGETQKYTLAEIVAQFKRHYPEFVYQLVKNDFLPDDELKKLAEERASVFKYRNEMVKDDKNVVEEAFTAGTPLNKFFMQGVDDMSKKILKVTLDILQSKEKKMSDKSSDHESVTDGVKPSEELEAGKKEDMPESAEQETIEFEILWAKLNLNLKIDGIVKAKQRTEKILERHPANRSVMFLAKMYDAMIKESQRNFYEAVDDFKSAVEQYPDLAADFKGIHPTLDMLIADAAKKPSEYPICEQFEKIEYPDLGQNYKVPASLPAEEKKVIYTRYKNLYPSSECEIVVLPEDEVPAESQVVVTSDKASDKLPAEINGELLAEENKPSDVISEQDAAPQSLKEFVPSLPISMGSKNIFTSQEKKAERRLTSEEQRDSKSTRRRQAIPG